MNTVQISIQAQAVKGISKPSHTPKKLTANYSKITNNNTKTIYLHKSIRLFVDEEVRAKFFSYFKESPREKYSRSKVKNILTEVFNALNCGNYSKKPFNDSKRIVLRQGSLNEIHIKLSGQAKIDFEDIASSIRQKANLKRQSLLFSLIETAYWQHADSPLGRTIN
jgi:hypothetical protein